MLCTKCGQEYEGSQCPRCDGPVILVNNSDYLARRKAYEEKQALKDRSASSDKKEKSPGDYGQELVKRVQKRTSQNKRKNDTGRQNKNNNMKAGEDTKEHSKVRIARRKVNKRMKMIAALIVVLIITGAAAFGIYKLATKKNYALYVSYNGKIYDIAGLDSNYLQKEIVYISNDGKVIYTNNNVINDEGSTNGTSLAMSSIMEVKKHSEAQTTLIEGNLNKAYVYEAKHIIVCLTNAGSLYTYDYERKEKPVTVADTVMQIWPASENTSGVYTGNADSLNTRKDVDAFLYSKSDGVYYYSCKDAAVHKIDKKTDTDADYIIDKNNSLIYRLSGATLTSALYKDGKTGDYIDIDSMTKEKNYIYNSASGEIVYVNADNRLRVIDNNKITDIASDVNAGSLSKVYNKSKAITYIADNNQYYMNSIKEKAVLIFKADSNTSTQGTHFYKNRIYSYDSDNILYSNTLKGNNSSQIGYVDRLWLGTELK